jgi:hypothetical protein
VKPVTVYSRRGNDWTAPYPLIVEAALHNLSSSFVIDGEGRCSCVKKSREQSTGKCVTEQVTRPSRASLGSGPSPLTAPAKLGSRWYGLCLNGGG